MGFWSSLPQVESDGRTLPWRVFGRAVRPFSLAVSLATLTVTVSMLSTVPFKGAASGSWLSQTLVGIAGATTTFILWWGWWGKATKFMTQGLLLAGAVWSAVAAEILMEGRSWPSGLIAACWAVGSLGAWLLEVNDPNVGRDRE
jgi:hypothetical protein